MNWGRVFHSGRVTKMRNQVFVFATLFACGAIVSTFLRSQERTLSVSDPLQFVRGSSDVQTRNDAAILDGWIEKVENGWEVGKNHDRVKTAFQTVVSKARKSTVRILKSGKLIALGTIVDRDGLILTKASEVEGQKSIYCQLYNGRRKRAKVIGIIDRHDLAMLKIQASGLQPVTFTETDLAVGSILATPSLDRKPVAIGVVSVVDREVKSDGILGITLHEPNGVPKIKEVLADSPAQEAGFHDADSILAINDQFVSSERKVVELIGRHLPGQAIRVLVERSGEKIELSPVLGRYSDLDEDNGDFQGYLGGKLSLRRTGFSKVIQHDTFLLPGHCGGPVVDLEGNVVGVNIARAERISSYALPSSVVIKAIRKLKNNQAKTSTVAKS